VSQQLTELQDKVGYVKLGLSPVQFKKLKQEKYDPSNQKVPNCSICLTEFEKGASVIRLHCHHAFDPDCLLRWTAENKICPLCKADILQ
jgi:E3 ubiquitin-protein ligase BIG BROTHER-like protein